MLFEKSLSIFSLKYLKQHIEYFRFRCIIQSDLHVQLNTKLYFYVWEEDGVILKERYAVTDIPIENNVGSWTEGTGRQLNRKKMVRVLD